MQESSLIVQEVFQTEENNRQQYITKIMEKIIQKELKSDNY